MQRYPPTHQDHNFSILQQQQQLTLEKCVAVIYLATTVEDYAGCISASIYL